MGTATRSSLAAGVLLAACAAVGAAGASFTEDTLAYAPQPASTLVSKRDVRFQVAVVQRGGVRSTVLAYAPAGSKPSPVAVISGSGTGSDARVAIQRLPLREGTDARVLDLLTLEHLYGLAMRQAPEGRFCLSQGTQPCDANRGRSHPELLRDLAAARQQALARAGQAITGAPWQSVSLSPVAGAPAGEDEVSVRIALDTKPMQGTTVYFHRAPHSSCAGKSDAGGIARCVLVDQHGDEEEHAGHEQVPVLVTFPGHVHPDGAVLPTTLVLEAKP